MNEGMLMSVYGYVGVHACVRGYEYVCAHVCLPHRPFLRKELWQALLCV